MAILTPKIQASTLVEVIVALIIIVSSFGMAMMVIDGNSKSANTHALIQAQQCVLMEKDKTMKERRFFNEETDYKSIHIVKTLTDYPNSTELKVLEIQAFDANKKILVSQRELIIAE
ncbi:MAG: hypothetical protein JXQ69_00975 [Paludibacteraceae bacterium]|nr:hypothetical protein [Paludibacteraceae bacterium]